MPRLIYILLLVMISGWLQAQQLSDSLRLSPSVISQIVITGNHRTRDYIILRELSFREKDSLPPYVIESALERSRQNLMNTALFNFVDIKYFQGTFNEVVIHIDVTERWYLWPVPVFEIADRNLNEWWQRRDFSRTNYGAFVRQDNFSGRKDMLQVQALFGYTRRYGIFYTIPYINKKLNTGLTGGFYYTRVKEVMYQVEGNRLQFINNPDRFLRREWQAYIRLTKRQGLYEFFNTTIDYRNSSVDDTVLALNPRYFTNEYPIQQHIGIAWNYRYDRRDYQPYALQGVYFEGEAARIGIGILPHEPRLTALSANIRYYHRLANRWHVAGSLKGRIMQRAGGPFFNQRALGYGTDYIRGYDLYVINGQDFTLLRSSLKYTLLKTRVYQLPMFRSNKFRKFPISAYLNAFYDAGYVSDKQFAEGNPLSNSLQYGYGISADVITYYDVVFRFEYALNRVGDRGFFFRLGAPF